MFSTTFDRQAKSSGKFSDEELQTLQREFKHHKDRINEYNIVMDTVSRTEGKSLVVFSAKISHHRIIVFSGISNQIARAGFIR